jgi:hypothetical protein
MLKGHPYEQAIAEGLFRARKPHKERAGFIGRFRSVSMEYYLNRKASLILKGWGRFPP